MSSYKQYINIPFLSISLIFVSIRFFFICRGCTLDYILPLFLVIYSSMLIFSFIFSISILSSRGEFSRYFLAGQGLTKKTGTMLFSFFIASPNMFLVNNGLGPYTKLLLMFLLNLLATFSETVEIFLCLYLFQLFFFTLLASFYEEIPLCKKIFHNYIFEGLENKNLRKDFIYLFFGNPRNIGQGLTISCWLAGIVVNVGIAGKMLYDGCYTEAIESYTVRSNYIAANPLATQREIDHHAKVHLEDNLPIFRMRRFISGLFESETPLLLHEGKFDKFWHDGTEYLFVTAPLDGRVFPDGSSLKLYETKTGFGGLTEVLGSGPKEDLYFGAIIGKLNGGMAGAALGARLGEAGMDRGAILQAVKGLGPKGIQSWPGSVLPPSKGPVATASFFETDKDSDMFFDFFQLSF